MPAHPRPGALITAAALTAALLPAGTAHAAPEKASTNLSTYFGPDRTITLVTGDRIAVAADDSQQVTALPSPGRQGTRFISRVDQDGHRTVIPVDAMPLLGAGALDPRLFDVTQLLADGYGDDKARTLPLIIQGASPPGLVQAQGTRELPTVGARAVKQERSSAAEMWKGLTTTKGLRGGVTRISLDGQVRLTLDASVPQIGAPTAWAAGYTGEGISVGVIDSGVDVDHPDLKDAVVETANFLDGSDPPPPGSPGPEDGKDYAGHGTHVASTIAGRGTASDGKYKGVAPGAKIYSGKACGWMGFCQESALIAAMEWAAAEKKVRVVNMSIGQTNTEGLDLLEETVQKLTARYGTLFVVASGNTGGPANSPATAPDALAVGAVDKSDALASFSSGGSIFGELRAKPEITAPGVDIMAAQSGDIFGQPPAKYMTISGTSMAAPHVAGAAVLLAQQHPDWTHAQLKAALVASAKPNPAISAVRQGGGRADLTRAIRQQVTASPVSLSFGEHAWPHEDDKPVTHTLTYANSGISPVTLKLSSTVGDRDGGSAPAELVSLSANSVTVPAGGTASVDVTVNPSVKTANGSLGGIVTAAGGDTTVQTPWVLYKDIEAYTLTLKVTDRAGNPATTQQTQLYSDIGVVSLYVKDGVGKVRLPAGKYTMVTQVYQPGAKDLTTLVTPTVNLNKDVSVDADARLGKPLSVTVPDAGATQSFGHVHFTYRVGESRRLGLDMTGDSFDRMYTAQIGPDNPDVVASVSGLWEKPGGSGDVYHLAWHQPGGYPTGFERKLTHGDLASVELRLASEAANSEGGLSLTNRQVGDYTRGWRVYSPVPTLPARRTLFHNGDRHTEFQTTFGSGVMEQGVPKLLSHREDGFTRYQAGRRYHQRWNHGIFGPAFPAPDPQKTWTDREVGISRTGNSILFWPSLFSDGRDRVGDPGALDSARVTVTRDGKPVYETESLLTAFDVPADEGVYEATAEFTRGAPAELATRLTTKWTFRSAPTTEKKYLPLAAIRLEPPLNDQNSAPAGTVFPLPIHVQGQPGTGVGATTSVQVQVSYDDGKTWLTPALFGGGDHRVALLTHPKGQGFVSVKAKVTSASGSTVEQTHLRVYRIAAR